METTTKKETATIKELVYEFKTLDGKDLELNEKSQIFLIINGIETTIPIKSLFVGDIDIDDEDITGFSVLQLISDHTSLKIDANTILKITFIDKTSGKEFYIESTRRPIMYDDIEISAADRLKYIDLLLATAEIPFQEAKLAEDKKAADLKAEQDAEQKRKDDEKEAEKEREAAEREREKENIMGGVEWEGQRKDFIDNGFLEYPFNDYRFFYKKAEGEDPAEIGFFLLSPGYSEYVELDENEIGEEEESYSFEDDSENDCLLSFDKKEDKVTIVTL